MTRILVQRGSTSSSSSNPSRSSSLPGPSSSCAEPQVSPVQVPPSARDDEASEEVQEQIGLEELLECNRSSGNDPLPFGSSSPRLPPPPVPPPKPSAANSNSRRFALGSSNPVRAGSSRRVVAWPTVRLMVRLRVTIVLMSRIHVSCPRTMMQ
ncbi:hypothetical protein V6N13_058560 [Hibiscus sabdariffa]|uniref:Uncharacterized protein n=1 Tax=Hibiscus sabdariffa TaxID=183260 RepID=A0ABR2GFR0_9ROSI